jgi:hypothetical protein
MKLPAAELKARLDYFAICRRDDEIAADGFAALKALIRRIVHEVLGNRGNSRSRGMMPPLIMLGKTWRFD